jgi:hypothetical protein
MNFTVTYGIADLSIEGVEVGEEIGYEKRYPILYTSTSYLPYDGEKVAVKKFTDGSYELAPASFFRISL